MKKYILAGPCTIGNVFGISGLEVPEGKFVIVSDDYYSNDRGLPSRSHGFGPSIVDGKIYSSRKLAEENLATAERPTVWAGGPEGKGYW